MSSSYPDVRDEEACDVVLEIQQHLPIQVSIHTGRTSLRRLLVRPLEARAIRRLVAFAYDAAYLAQVLR